MSVPWPCGLFVLFAIIWVCDGPGHKIFFSVMKPKHLEATNHWLRWAKQRLFRGFMIILLIDILLSYDDGDMTWQTFFFVKQSLCSLLPTSNRLPISWAHQGLCSWCKFHVNVKPECRQETSTWQIGYS